MNTLLKLVVVLLAGLVTFVVTAVAGIAWFAPRIEFSIFVGIPAGLWAAIAVMGLLGVVLWTRDLPTERANSRAATIARWAAFAVALDVVLVYAVGLVWFFAFTGNVAVLLLIYGTPVTMVVAAVIGGLAGELLRGRNGETAGRNDGRTDTPAR